MLNAPKHASFRLFKASKAATLQIILLSFIINLLSLASPLFIRHVYDRIIPYQSMTLFSLLIAGVFFALTLDFILRNIRTYVLDNIGKSIDTKISGSLFHRLLGLELSARSKSVGSMAQSVQALEGCREFITSTTLCTLVDIPFVMLFLVMIGFMAGSLVWVPLLAIPLILSISLLIQRPLARLSKQGHQLSTDKQAHLIESLACTETIKAYSAEQARQNRFETLSKCSAALNTKIRILTNLATHFALYAQTGASLLLVILGVYQISAAQLSVGALVACTLLCARALSPISQIATLVYRYQQARTAFATLNQVMNCPLERSQLSQFIPAFALKGEIVFSKVSFKYPNAALATLNQLSFKISPGEKVGIIGRMGSGKTTIEKLIMKFYQPSAGEILLDQHPLSRIDPADLRPQIAYVPQEVVLLAGSIRENILMGSTNCDEKVLERAARLSGVMDFVEGHPEGFERQVGEGGHCLSGGQRQAIAIARALLLDPPIILMDEPASALDETQTALFMKRLEPELCHKTLVLITHKASLLRLVSRLIVIDRGIIIADGPKEHVLKELSEGSIKTDQAQTSTVE